VIGGSSAGAGNLISGNTSDGVLISGSETSGNTIAGNLIGTGVSGQTILANANGVEIGKGATANLIGGSIAAARNVISGNTSDGVFISGSGTSGNTVEGNFLGSDIAGATALGDANGVEIGPATTGDTIGGTFAGARNIISGNSANGVLISGPGASGNAIEGNYIGTGPDGKEVVGSAFTGIIIFAGAANNIVGGSAAGAGNLISGFFGYGIYIDNAGASGNWIEGNDIGTDATGTNALPNSTGLIIFGGATNNIIGLKSDGSGSGNQVAFNYNDGVQISDTNTAGIAVRGNSIFANGGLGIDIVNGANNLQSFPVVTNAFGYGSGTIIAGTLNSAASRSFFIDFYRNLTADDEGQFYLGTISVNTDGSGKALFVYTNIAANYSGQYLTATATSAGGDTSEFSLAVLATNLPVASAQFVGPFQSSASGFTFSLALQTNFSYRIQTATNLVAPVTWTDLTNFVVTNSPFPFTDRSATSYRTRFYRAVSP